MFGAIKFEFQGAPVPTHILSEMFGSYCVITGVVEVSGVPGTCGNENR